MIDAAKTASSLSLRQKQSLVILANSQRPLRNRDFHEIFETGKRTTGWARALGPSSKPQMHDRGSLWARGLVHVDPPGHYKLTAGGRIVAKAIIRSHPDLVPPSTRQPSIATKRRRAEADGQRVDEEQFATATEYFRAFRKVQGEGGILPGQRAILQAHFDSSAKTATWAQLAKAVGYPNGNSVNLIYGSLAKRVAAELGIKKAPRGFWLYVLAGWADRRDTHSGHTAFVLRPAVVRAITRLGLVSDRHMDLLPGEMSEIQSFREGAVSRVLVNTYERNREARRLCLARRKPICCICDFDFGKVYGPEAEGFIHVHHRRPLAECDGEYELDPISDLEPVCPNCHAFLHLGGVIRTSEDVRKLVNARRRRSRRTDARD